MPWIRLQQAKSTKIQQYRAISWSYYFLVSFVNDTGEVNDFPTVVSVMVEKKIFAKTKAQSRFSHFWHQSWIRRHISFPTL
jgi:hypothetical protein